MNRSVADGTRDACAVRLCYSQTADLTLPTRSPREIVTRFIYRTTTSGETAQSVVVARGRLQVVRTLPPLPPPFFDAVGVRYKSSLVGILGSSEDVFIFDIFRFRMTTCRIRWSWQWCLLFLFFSFIRLFSKALFRVVDSVQNLYSAPHPRVFSTGVCLTFWRNRLFFYRIST